MRPLAASALGWASVAVLLAGGVAAYEYRTAITQWLNPGPGPTAILISGNIEAHQSVLGFKTVQSRIVDLPFDEGQSIEKDALIARLDDSDYRQCSTQQQAFATNFFVLNPFFILSGFSFPITSMPQVLQWFTYLNPLRYFLVIIRGTFLKGIEIEVLWPDMLALAVIATILLTISIFRFRKSLD